MSTKSERHSDDSDDEQDHRDVESEMESEYDKNCLYNYVTVDVEEPEDIMYEVGTDERMVLPEDRITKPILTKYEYVRLLSDRTKQIKLGAKSMIKNIHGYSAKEIAAMEIEKNVVPLMIHRPLPSGEIEVWSVSELKH